MLEIYSLDPSVSALDNHSLHGSQIRPILQEILGWKWLEASKSIPELHEFWAYLKDVTKPSPYRTW